MARGGSSRRGFLTGLLVAPAAFAAARAAGAIRGAARVARPAARGTSSTRCGLCGARDHSMLRCPNAREVL
ncbi:MAG TPA: hypothetical protein VID69_01165 [Actinomycetota bacterium]